MSFIYVQHTTLEVRYAYPVTSVAEIAHFMVNNTFRLTTTNGDEHVLDSEPFTIETRPASADFELWTVCGDPTYKEDLRVIWQCFPVESIELSVPVFNRNEAAVTGLNPLAGMQPELGSGEQVLVDLAHKRAAWLGSGSPLEWSRDLAQVLRYAASRYIGKGCTFALPDWLEDGGEIEATTWTRKSA